MPNSLNIFEDRLNREILESESVRVKILALVAAIPVVFLTIMMLFLKDRILEVMVSLEPLYLIIIVLTVFGIRQYNISRIIKKLLNDNRQLSNKIRYINIFLEVSFPTLVLFILSFYWDG